MQQQNNVVLLNSNILWVFSNVIPSWNPVVLNQLYSQMNEPYSGDANEMSSSLTKFSFVFCFLVYFKIKFQVFEKYEQEINEQSKPLGKSKIHRIIWCGQFPQTRTVQVQFAITKIVTMKKNVTQLQRTCENLTAKRNLQLK